MGEIPLRNRKGLVVAYAVVDDIDYAFLMQWNWHRVHGYARRASQDNQNLRMHNVILPPPPNKEVDHINGDKLDNRRENLRIATHAQNSRNIRKTWKSSSHYKGVTWDKQYLKWRAQIIFDGKPRKIGRFTTEIDAARAYDAKAREFFQEFAALNFPYDTEVIDATT